MTHSSDDDRTGVAKSVRAKIARAERDAAQAYKARRAAEKRGHKSNQ